MIKVELPNISETYNRALHEVISPFLSTGNPTMIMGLMVYFYKVELHYNVERLDAKGEPLTGPFIVFAAHRAGARRSFKCQDPRQHSQPFGYEVRQQVPRTAYAGIPRTLVLAQPPYPDAGTFPRKSSILDVERIWSQLFLVLENQYNNLNARGLFTPRLPAVPAYITHPDYYLVQGELQLEARFTLTRNNAY